MNSKAAFLLSLLCLAACNDKTTADKGTSADTTDRKIITSKEEKPVSRSDTTSLKTDSGKISAKQAGYSNKRFKDVTVSKENDTTFIIKGKAQVFEAAFAWVIEDGHEELKTGFAMTDAGAPEWGNFRFTVTAKKKRPNSVLHLILFESSPKDGSRQFQLPVLLN